MKRIGKKVVQLDNYEIHASQYRERLMDKGMSIPDAVTVIERVFPGLDPAFIEYLSE